MIARISQAQARGLLSKRPQQSPIGQIRSAKPNKYGAKRTAVDGISFASAKEARRYSQLRLLAATGEIKDLVLQPRFPLKVNGKLICTYVADFVYTDASGDRITEDAKGARTDVYVIKRKLMAAVYGIYIREV